MNEFLDVDSLKIDHSYQRQPDMQRVRRLARPDVFDQDAFEAITVSRRENDEGDFIVEGQHRWLIAKAHGETKIEARIKTGLTVADEAALFHTINSGRKQPTPYETYRAGVAAKRQPYVDLEKGLQDRYLGIAQTGSMNRISCVQAVMRVANEGGAATALRAIDLVIAAWGRDTSSYGQAMIGGVGHFLARGRLQKKKIDFDRVEKILAKRPPIGWMQAIVKATGPYSSGSQTKTMARLLAEQYNSRRTYATRVEIR